MSASAATTPSIVAVVGNPRPGSRTLGVATQLAQRLADQLGGKLDIIDIAELAGDLFPTPGPRVTEALATTAAADLVVVATPVQKACFTGLLKSFLDLLPTRAFADAVAVPLTVAGRPDHQLVADVHLRPVLLELGASLPTASFTVHEAQFAELSDVIDTWLADNTARLPAFT